MQAPSLRAALCSSALLCPLLFASTAAIAQTNRDSAHSAKPVIELAPSAVPDRYRLQPKPGEASFESAPANFHAFASARVGESADEESITLKFNAATQLTKIESTKDFVIDPASGCQAGNRYSANDSCVLLIRFTPQGAGQRLGKVTIANTASPQPMAFGLGGYGYAPALSFTPAVITTVPGTYPSSVGLLSGAQNLTVDGSDTLYIADTGNGVLRDMDSSGNIISLASGYTSLLGVAVDSFGEAYFDVPSTGKMYEVYDYGPVVQVSGSGTTSCPASTPCSLSSEALGTPGEMSVDPYNHLFFVDSHQGAAFSTVQPVPANLIFLYDPFPYQTSPTSAMAVDSGDNLYSLWANGGVCEIVQQSLYNAENSNVTFNKIAGEHTCGFAGDGGQAGNAEIGAKAGQIAFDSAGNLYFSDTNNQRVRRIDYVTGQINTIAGNGTAGYTGDNGQATSAELSAPTGVAVDSQGQVYIISSAATGQVIRKLTTEGILSFGNQVVGSSSTAKTVTVSNTGNSSMTLTNAVIGGTNAADFTINTATTSCLLTSGSSLAAGASCKIGFVFKPAATGSRTASLVLNDNTVTNANTILLNGAGITAAATVSLSPTSLSFGPETVGSTTASQTVTLKNTGGAALTITGIAVTGTNASSFVFGNSCPSNLAAGASCTIHGHFSPTATGAMTAAITITDSAANSPQSVPLSGTGTAAPTTKTLVQISSLANPATACESVAFSARVSALDGTMPTGSVKLMNGSTVLGEATLISGQARFVAEGLNRGPYTLTANYGGDGTHSPSISAAFNEAALTSPCETPKPISPRAIWEFNAFNPIHQP